MINVWLGTTAETKTWLSLPSACCRHKFGFLISWHFVMNDLFHFSPPPIITKVLDSAFKKKNPSIFLRRTFFFSFSYLFPLLSSWQGEMPGHCSNCIRCVVACRTLWGGWVGKWVVSEIFKTQVLVFSLISLDCASSPPEKNVIQR